MTDTAMTAVHRIVENTIAWLPEEEGTLRSAAADPSAILKVLDLAIRVRQLDSRAWSRFRSGQLTPYQARAYRTRINLVRELDGLRWSCYLLAYAQCRAEGREEPSRPECPRMY